MSSAASSESAFRPGLVNLPNSPAAQSVLLELVRRDAEKHHCFFNDDGFHNHLPHHLVTAYDLGATPALLQAIWDDEAAIERPIGRSGKDIEVGNWTERLGEWSAYGSYLAFFESQIAEHGVEKTLVDYVLAPKANGNGAKMLGRFLAGVVHPLLHVGFGIEFGQNKLVAAGLAMTAVTSPKQPNLVLDATTGLPEPKAKPVEGATLFQLLKEVYESETLHPIMPYDPNASLTKRFDALAADPTRAEELKRIYSQWSLSPNATPEEEDHKMAECLLQSTLLLFSSGKPDRTPRLDFFFMHLVTSSICLPSIMRVLTTVEAKNTVLQGYARVAAMWLILRGRPRIDAELIMRFPEVPTPPGPTSLGSDSLGFKSKDIAVANPWLAVIQNGLHHRDAHVVKTVRSLYYGANILPTLSGGKFGLEHIKGGEKLDGSLWIRAAGVVSKEMGWVAFGEKAAEDWDRSALGWDDAWKDGK